MSSTNKTTYYDLSQYVGSDKPTYLGDYNSDMLKIDTGIHAAADAADRALTTANSANSTATSASTTASTALSTAQTASTTATQAQTTAETALTNSGAAQSAAEEAETAARANTITNLAPAYDSSLTYAVDDLVTYIDAQGSGKMYKCIVGVSTPEAFNINKWDDVTTSEAYGRKSTVISSVTSDGVKRRDELLYALINGVTIDPDAEYLLTQTDNSTYTISTYHERLASPTQIQLAEPFIGVSLPTSCRNITLDTNGPSNCKAGSIELTTNGANINDTSSIVSSSGAYTFTLHKLATK